MFGKQKYEYLIEKAPEDMLYSFTPEALAPAYIVKSRLNLESNENVFTMALRLLEEVTKHLDEEGKVTILKPNKETLTIKLRKN